MERPIRILCVFAGLDRCGSETMCMNLYRNIDRSKIQFDFIKHTHKKCDYEDEIHQLGGIIYEAPRFKIYNYFQYRKWWLNFLTDHPEYQIIHGHFFTISAVYFSFAKKMGRTTVAHSHIAFQPVKGVKGWIKRLLESRIEKMSDYRLACSQDAGKFLYPHRDFQVLHNAIDSEKYVFNESVRNRIRKELNIEDKFVIGTIGRLTDQKNPEMIINIINDVVKNNPNSVLLWIGDGELRQKIEISIKTLGIGNNVILLGNVPNVNEYLQSMDIFILPSKYEGLGIVAIEAQASGLVCLCSDNVPKEVNITGKCKFLPLDKGVDWVDEVLKTKNIRENCKDFLIKSGYDVLTTSRWIEEFYLSIV